MPDTWRVFTYQPVIDRWAALPSYTQRNIARYLDWVADVEAHGPPDDTIGLSFDDDELVLANVPGTDRLVVAFIVSTYDRTVVVRDIT